MRQRRHQVDISVGISGPHAFAVRDRRIRLVRHHVHRILRPTFVTMANVPLLRAQDARRSARDLPVVTSEDDCDRLTRRANQQVIGIKQTRNVNDVVVDARRSPAALYVS
jgi:hypothetical protein